MYREGFVLMCGGGAEISLFSVGIVPIVHVLFEKMDFTYYCTFSLVVEVKSN